MKRIYKNIDIEFDISDFYALQHIKEGNFTFFTNSQAEGIRKTTADIIDNIIFIDGKDINLLKEGVLFVSYYCEEFDSRAWDNVLNKEGKFTTNYYIKNGNTIEAEPTEKSNFYTKTEVDTKIDAKQDKLINCKNIASIDGNDLTKGGYINIDKYTQAEANEKFQVKGDYPTKLEMNDAIDKAVTSGEVDLTNYYKKTETYSQTEVNNLLDNYQPSIDLNGYAKKTEIPTKTSDLINNSGYLTEHQSLVNYPTKTEMHQEIDKAITGGTEINLTNYYTKNETYSKEEINNKNYLTKHQDISHKANKADVYTKEETYTQQEVNNLLANYSPTGGTPTPPITIDSELSEASKNAVQNKVVTKELNEKTETVTLTQAEYNKLTNEQKNSNTLYVITDAPTINIDNKLDVTAYTEDKKTFALKSEIPTDYVSNEALEAKGYITEHQSLVDYALKSEIPSTDNFVTNDVLNGKGYITEVQLDSKGYLTEHQNIDGKMDTTVAEATYAKKTELADKADKTAIPSKTSQLINDSNYLTSHQDISGKLDTSAYTEDKKSFALKTEIPTDYVSNEALEAKGYITEHQSLVGYAKTTEIPTKTSQLTNDSGFLTSHQSLADYALKSEIPSTADFVTNADLALKGYLTEHQDITGKLDISAYTEDKKSFALKSEIPTDYITNETLNSKGYLTEVPLEYITETELNQKGYLTEHQSLTDYALKSDLPKNTSELTNDSNFLTSHQDISGKADKSEITDMLTKTEASTTYQTVGDYITNETLNSKGYLTEHQSLDGYALKSDIPNIDSKVDVTAYTEDKKSFALKSEIPNTENFATKTDLNGKVDNSEIVDMATQSWVNGKNYLTSVPSEYVTDTELMNKNFATNTTLSQYVDKKYADNTYATKRITDDLENRKADMKYVDTTFARIVRLTQQDYDQLPTKDNNTLYIII